MHMNVDNTTLIQYSMQNLEIPGQARNEDGQAWKEDGQARNEDGQAWKEDGQARNEDGQARNEEQRVAGRLERAWGKVV